MSDLIDTLDAETAAVAAGTATACGAPSPDPSITACLRTSTHTTDGWCRESHAGQQHTDLNDPTSPLQWVTWTDPVASAPTP